MGGALMELIRQAFELTAIAIAGIYMATCTVAFPIACFMAWRKRQRYLRDVEYSHAYYMQPKRISR
jgi:hypothetical protein